MPRSEIKFLRVSKYLVPHQALIPSFQGESPPRQLAGLDELARRFPTKVQVRTEEALEPIDAANPPAFQTVYRGQVEKRPMWQSWFNQPNVVASIRDGASVGRHCCLIGPDQTAIAESGFNLTAQELASNLKLGRIHPYFRRYRAQGDLRTRISLPRASRITGRVAALNNRYSHNFFHWLIEVAPRIAALQIAGLEPDFYLIDCQSGFQKNVLRLLGIPTDRLIQPHCRLNLHCDELHYVARHGLLALRQFARSLQPDSPSASPADGRLYISRRKARNRRIVNESQLELALHRRGFQSVCFEDLSVQDQFRLVRDSSIIVAVHGAALANTIFARPGTSIIEIYPRQRNNLELYPDLSLAMGMRHTTVLGDYTPIRKNISVAIRDVEFAVEQSL